MEHRTSGDVILIEKYASYQSRAQLMTASIILLQPVVALIAGVLILLMPRLLNYVVALYLVVVGVMGLVQLSA